MNLDTLFDNINSAYRGSDDDAPASGTPDYILWLNTTNRKISEWARDGKNTWRSLFDIRDVGTISAGTQEYDLDDTILLPSDKVVITTSTGHTINYKLCEPQERDRYFHSAYIHGSDPQVLTFSDTILAADQIVGGNITMAGYYLPDPLTSGRNTVPVDDPYWLVEAVASELAFNDITYAAKAADLNTKANNLYSIMASNNRRSGNNNPRQLRTNVNPIPSTRSVWINDQARNNY